MKKFDLLDSEHLDEQINILRDRVGERFPDSGLYQVAIHLAELSHRSAKTASYLGKPNYFIRAITVTLALLIVVGTIVAFMNFEIKFHNKDLLSVVQFLESLINDIVFIGVAIFFLVSIETKYKRSRACPS